MISSCSSDRSEWAMSKMKAFVAFTAGALMLVPAAEAQTQVQPTQPGGPQIQPPRPGRPEIVQPRPPQPEIQPPRPPRPRPPKPVRPPRPIIINPGWCHGNPGWAYGHAVLYSGTHYRGHYVTVRSSVSELRQYGFDNRALSIHARGRWLICSKSQYRGDCITLRGSDPSFGRLAGRVSSIRYIGH